MLNKTFRAKPIVLEAMQVTTENFAAIRAWLGYKPVWTEGNLEGSRDQDLDAAALRFPSFENNTLGEKAIQADWWILKDPDGTFRVCDPDVFNARFAPDVQTYELRPQDVEAILLNETNLEYAAEWCGGLATDRLMYGNTTRNIVAFSGNDASPGDYIFKDGDGDFDVMSGKDFRRKYRTKSV